MKNKNEKLENKTEAQQTYSTQYGLYGKKESSEQYLTEIKGTPFTIVEKKGKFNILIGNNLCLDKWRNTKAECLKKIYQKDWMLIMTAFMYINTKLKEN